MSYRKGDIRVAMREYACKDWESHGFCNHEPEHPKAPSAAKEYPVVFLPHSCDEWVIGGEFELEAMLADLHAAMDVLRAHRTGKAQGPPVGTIP